ncbi:MAG: cytochrome c oxidase subunit II [Gemmatimonadales bacterium]
MKRRRARFAITVSVTLLLAGCHGVLSTLDPATPESSRLAELTRILVLVAAIVFVAVVVILMAAIRRHRGEAQSIDLANVSSRPVLVGGAIVPSAILLATFIAALGAMREYPMDRSRAITFRVIGHQWWWDVEYLDASGNIVFHTANEIHVPVGRPVRVILNSADVIHSFWVPALHGKIDLIPGDTNEVRFTASRPGVYRGECAEFCGLQHAHMGFMVVADDSASFEAWAARERSDAVAPDDSASRDGMLAVTGGPCAACHTIRGTAARGAIGPDLTHIGSRQTLAAGLLPNNAASMEAWITDAERLKPGTTMPSLREFSGSQLREMAAYLRQLR